MLLARDRNAGWVFITDDTLANPWDTLPTYWDAEVCAVQLLNAGDLDGSGGIGLEDLATLLAHYGATAATPAQGELTGDGIVDLSDLSKLLAAFGSAC